MTGQSAQAACNSDAKTVEIAVQAYIASPDNATNAPPAAIADLQTAPFGTPADTFLADAPSNAAYTVTTAGGNVFVTPKGGAAAQYDTTGGTDPCTAVK